jgi:RNA polymerase sigma-70 factor (ECF subfamily)
MVANESDAELVKKAQEGNRDAFITLYNRYLPKVFNRVKSRVPVSDAEDVTQNIFIAIMQSLNSFKGQSAFSTWTYTIVNRQIADYYRKRYRRNESVGLDELENTHSSLSYEEEHLAEHALIQKALLDLPEHYQEIILMRFADGLKFKSIAKKQGQSLEAVKSLYRRAIQAMQKKLDGA